MSRFASIDLGAVASGAIGTVERAAKQGKQVASHLVQATALYLVLPPLPLMGEENEGTTRKIPASLVQDASRGGITALAKAVNKGYSAAFAGRAPAGEGPPLMVWVSDYTPNVTKHPDADGTVAFAIRPFVPKSATSAKVKEGHTLGSPPADMAAWVALVEQAPENVQDALAAALDEAQRGAWARQERDAQPQPEPQPAA